MPVRPGFFVGQYAIYLIARGTLPRDHAFGADEMRRDELMKPDLLSEMLLTIFGLAILIFLASTMWIAMIGH